MGISGVIVAPISPISPEGKVDFKALHLLIEYLLSSGVDGICLGGATSEFCRFSIEDRAELVGRIAKQVVKRTRLVVAIGACSYCQAIELGDFAAERHVDAVLIPMPYFYRYSQDDLEHFCRVLARRMKVPSLLYNIPQFTNPLDAETSIRLLRTEPDLVGIKDSSGDRMRLKQFINAELGDEISLMIGQDNLFYDALEAGWSGIISGLGNLCPELLTGLYKAFRSGDRKKAQPYFVQIKRLSSELEKFPAPWGVKVGLEARGLDCGLPALPLSQNRIKQIERFQDWFAEWLKNDLQDLLENGKVDQAAHFTHDHASPQ